MSRLSPVGAALFLLSQAWLAGVGAQRADLAPPDSGRLGEVRGQEGGGEGRGIGTENRGERPLCDQRCTFRTRLSMQPLRKVTEVYATGRGSVASSG